MDFKFSMKIDNRLHKAAVHNPTPAAITLAVRGILYRHFKTDKIDIPYIGEAQIREFCSLGYLDLPGVTVYGERIEDIQVKIDS
jgi:hypothetical protein